MSTWVMFGVNLDPWSYENLLLKQAILMEGKPDISRSGALRYVLRRLRFTDEQKQAYTSWVRDEMADNTPEALAKILEDETG